MRDSGYWIVLSVGWDRERPRGRRWDALPVSVQPTDDIGEPDPGALAAERPGRVIVWGVWAPMTGWAHCGQVGPARLVERFASVPYAEQGPFQSAVRLGIACAMRLALGLTPQDRDPFPAPGAN
jgi:hypothetical protein